MANWPIVRDSISKTISEKSEELKEEILARELEKEKVDITLPGRPFPVGSRHP